MCPSRAAAGVVAPSLSSWEAGPTWAGGRSGCRRPGGILASRTRTLPPSSPASGRGSRPARMPATQPRRKGRTRTPAGGRAAGLAWRTQVDPQGVPDRRGGHGLRAQTGDLDGELARGWGAHARFGGGGGLGRACRQPRGRRDRDLGLVRPWGRRGVWAGVAGRAHGSGVGLVGHGIANHPR